MPRARTLGTTPARSSSARRSSAWVHRNSVEARNVLGLVEDPDLVLADVIERRSRARGRRPSTSAASASWPCSSRARSVGEIRRQLVGGLAQARRAACSAPCADQELARRQQLDGVDRAHAALVGRIERAQRLDLVAEPLDAHGQRLAGRKDVDDAAAARELAAAGDLGQRLVAQVDQLAQHALLADALARLRAAPAVPGRSAGASVCWKSAWTPATRTRGAPDRHAARAATRAADSSRISSLRS